MTRTPLLALVISLLPGAALASQPGQRLDCSDWVAFLPGLTCSLYRSGGPDGFELGTNLVIDNQGRALKLINSTFYGSGVLLVRFDGVSRWEGVGLINDRAGIHPVWDRIAPTGRCIAGFCNDLIPGLPAEGVLHFDAVHGRVLIPVRTYCTPDFGGQGVCDPQVYGGSFQDGEQWSVIAIDGFASLFEVAISYKQPSSLSFTVPVHPEGLPAADTFSVYTGDLRSASDLSRAVPIDCTVPDAGPPAPGEQLSVFDSLPDPPPGDGRYYLASPSYRDQRRAGRAAPDGTLRGRETRSLPVCR